MYLYPTLNPETMIAQVQYLYVRTKLIQEALKMQQLAFV